MQNKALLRTAVAGFGVLLCAFASATVDRPQDVDPRWEEILGPTRAVLPEPLAEVIWRDDLTAAAALASEQNRPLFVTMRCLPCKQCADFDKEVLEGGPLLSPLLRQFVTVRLTDAADLDLRVFPVEGYQDLDLSWWGWFLSPQLRVYGVFGGRDHISDATRISAPALANTLERVLEHHYDPRREGWDIDGPEPQERGRASSPRELPGYSSWRRQTTEPQDCMHCHQIVEVLRQPAIDSGSFDKQKDFEVWPLPENTGLTLDRDHGLRIDEVAHDSPAHAAGLRVGDILAAGGRRRLFGQADFRGVLHRADRTDARIPLVWLRDGVLHTGTLSLQEGWKRTVLDWRMSVSQGNVGGYPTFWPLGANAAERRRFRIPTGSMAVKPYFGPNPSGAAHDAGLHSNHVITAVDGESPDLVGRPFLVWFRMERDPGDRVELTVRDRSGGETRISYRLPVRR